MAALRLETVAKLIRNHNLVMFSKTFCPFCLKAKATLKDAGVSDMKIVELDEDKDGDSLQVPVLILTIITIFYIQY
jgi:glutaredoxin